MSKNYLTPQPPKGGEWRTLKVSFEILKFVADVKVTNL
jgi:hypothetical protein